MRPLSRWRRFLALDWSIQWRTILVRLPDIVPLYFLRIYSPAGPQPIVVDIQSRDPAWKIPVLSWIHSVPDDGVLPVHLDFHGGGFILGSAFEQAPFCSMMARERDGVVISVNHRLGPLDHFPVAVEDAEDVLKAILDTDEKTSGGVELRRAIQQHCEFKLKFKPKRDSSVGIRLDPSHLTISGSSSGGNLAYNLALSVQTADINWPSLLPQGSEPIPVLLLYPSFDVTRLPHDRPRPEGMPPPGSFARSMSKVLSPTYCPVNMREHPRASPGLVDVRNIHPRVRLFVVLAEFDTLAAQSEKWQKDMHEGGQDWRVDVFKAKGVPHGWCTFPERFIDKNGKEQKKEAYTRMHNFLANFSKMKAT